MLHKFKNSKIVLDKDNTFIVLYANETKSKEFDDEKKAIEFAKSLETQKPIEEMEFHELVNYWNEKDKEVQCNNCMNKYYEDELELIKEKSEYYKGCPNCKTDNYLINLN